MVYSSLPSRKSTRRAELASRRALALVDGLRLFLGIALIVDAVRTLLGGEPSMLGALLRWPGGRPLPGLDGFLLGAAFLVRHRAAAMVLVAHAVLAGLNIGEFYLLRAQGLRAAALPFSLVSLALLVGAVARTFDDGPARPRSWTAAGVLAAGPAFLLLQLFAFGSTDYVRPAQAVVVFGARVSADGEPSLALSDRVAHGIRLYHAGIAPRLVLSGSPDEVATMRSLALQGKVPPSAIELDPRGLNTYLTLANLKERRVVAVSHYYHLARIKLAASRLGLSCATVPCRMSRRLAREPYFVARECAALAWYYLRPGPGGEEDPGARGEAGPAD